MVKQQLISGLVMSSGIAPDPICKPCLAGKMHVNPFPSSETQATCPLELIHSDLHVLSLFSLTLDFCYWVSFIDDFTRFRTVIPLRVK